MTYEQKRDVLKRWYLDNGKTMWQFICDAQEIQRMNGYDTISMAVDQLYSEMEALGNFRTHS